MGCEDEGGVGQRSELGYGVHRAPQSCNNFATSTKQKLEPISHFQHLRFEEIIGVTQSQFDKSLGWFIKVLLWGIVC